ncbi:MAG: LEA type 2 family protein [Conexivisphaera sp.]
MRASTAISIASAVLLAAGICLMALPLASTAALRFSGVQYVNGSPTVTVSNAGPFEVYGLSVRAEVLSPSGLVLAAGSSAPVDLPPGSTSVISVPVEPNGTALSSVQPLSLRQLTLEVEASANPTGLLPVHLGLSIPVNVSGAVSDVVVQQPELVSASSGSMVVLERASFLYDVPYVPLSGTLEVRVANGTVQVGGGSGEVSASPGQEVKVAVPIELSVGPEALLTRPQEFNVSAYLVSGGLSYFLGSEVYSWSPPLGGLSIGAPAVSPVNSSYYRLALPVSFQDEQSSGFRLSVTGQLYCNGSPVSSSSWSGYASPGANSLELSFMIPARCGTAPKHAALEVTAFNSTLSEEVNLG